MKEDFLQLVWQQQMLLRTTPWIVDGEVITVIKPGFKNKNAGPDFTQAKLKWGNIEWNGSVEIHIQASEWNQHLHSEDTAYNSVILHVVWENNADVFRKDGTRVPVLEIKDLVSLPVLLRYRSLTEGGKKQKPCASFLPVVDHFVLVSMEEQLLVERLERKAKAITGRLKANNGNWLETLYQTLAWNLGLTANAEAMLILSHQVPTKILAAQGWKMERILPLLLGMGGFLEGRNNPMKEALDEFMHLMAKHELKVHPIPWTSFRVGMKAHPFFRVVLLAQIATKLPDWLHILSETSAGPELFESFVLPPPPGWVQTLCSDLGLGQVPDKLSDFIRNSLIINTFAPFLTAMGMQMDERSWIQKSIEWLEAAPPETNALIKNWKGLSVNAGNAAQSQALIELNNGYCEPKRCMECGVGRAFLKYEGGNG